MSDRRALLLSVRPRFAEAILAGKKTVEVRRRPVKVAPGTRAIIYASTPAMAVVGTARIQRAIVCKPDFAWRRHGEAIGLAHSEFEEYLAGNMACLLILGEARSLDSPLSLQHLRKRTSFQPPQSYRYVSPSDPIQIRALVS